MLWWACFFRIEINLFAKGQSGNPGGRPKDSLTTAIRTQIAKKAPGVDVTYREVIALKLLELAGSGNIEAIKLVLDRVDGKVPDVHNVDGRIHIDLQWGDDGSE